MSAPKVLYIAGFGRSGSTLLGNALGSVPGCCSVGELHMLWQALRLGTGCGCGSPVRECELWSAVLDRLRAAGVATDPEEVRRWQLHEARVVHTPRLMRRDPAAHRPELAAYSELLSALYRAIADVSGAAVVVDSSKTPADAALLPRVAGIDPYVVQLVRDPRAVAFSQGRRQPTLDTHRGGEMHRRGVMASATRWVLVNGLTRRVIRRAAPRSTLLRYEDFIGDPRAALGDLTSLIGRPEAVLPLVAEDTVELAECHTVWGNRSRFLVGPVRLRADEEWRQHPSVGRALVSALTSPWLPRYGYPLRVGEPAAGPQSGS
ncbi:MAG: sulfotransferase [Actinomycetota bacterium]